MLEIIERLTSVKATLTKDVAKVEASLDFYSNQVDALTSTLAELNADLELTRQANLVLSNLVSTRISTVKGSIERIINEGLALIFDEVITIEIQEAVKRNKTEFSMVIKKDEFEGGSESFGGGVLSVIAFLLKVVTNLLTKKAKLQVYDESLTFVSAHYQVRLGQFIKKLCKDLDYTIVLVSHQPLLSEQADLRYTTNKVNGETVYQLITQGE